MPIKKRRSDAAGPDPKSYLPTQYFAILTVCSPIHNRSERTQKSQMHACVCACARALHTRAHVQHINAMHIVRGHEFKLLTTFAKQTVFWAPPLHCANRGKGVTQTWHAHDHPDQLRLSLDNQS